MPASGRLAVLAAFVVLPSLALPARAQLLNTLKGAAGLDQGGGSGGLGALGGGLPSVDQAPPGNLAGVIQYCVRNNYLSGGAASSVKNAIMGKVAGGSGDSAFKAGNSGMLETGQGQSFGLGGGGIKAQVTHKVCDLVLQHAKSML